MHDETVAFTFLPRNLVSYKCSLWPALGLNEFMYLTDLEQGLRQRKRCTGFGFCYNDLCFFLPFLRFGACGREGIRQGWGGQGLVQRMRQERQRFRPWQLSRGGERTRPSPPLPTPPPRSPLPLEMLQGGLQALAADCCCERYKTAFGQSPG